MKRLLKKRWIILATILLMLTKGYSQECFVDYFSKSYTGPGLFGMGGSQGNRLTIFPDSSMMVSNSRFLTRVSKKGDIRWSKFVFGSGNSIATNALVDYDSSIVCTMSSAIMKFDTSGNVLYQKKIHFGVGTNEDTTNAETLTDIAILANGDKVVLYKDNLGGYGAYLFRFDKDMTTIRWCKNIQYGITSTPVDNIGFTNVLIEGDQIVVAGCTRGTLRPAAYGFMFSFDAATGNLTRDKYFNCSDLGAFNRLYKGNGQYFVAGFLYNQNSAAGRYFYVRIDSSFNVLGIRRIVGYTDNFPTTLSFAPQSDNSLYGMVGRGGFTTTMFYIDKYDNVAWVRAYFIDTYPSDVKQNSDALFFAGDHDYNAVGIGSQSSFSIHKSDFNGNVASCVQKYPATFETYNYGFTPVPPQNLRITDRICTILTDNNSFGNYSLTTRGCSYKSICDSIKLLGDTALCYARTAYYTGRRNATCKNPITWSVNPAVNYTTINDSTIAVNFTNNGQYKITSKINDPCNEYVDSVDVHVNLSGLLDMPGDSTLCTGNTIRLLAGNGFKTYRWQDGSTDSVFIVTQTGQYFITVTDYCGNIYSDTIIIHPANFYFSIGSDTVKCNNDNLTLTATPGFYNYQWSPPYNLTPVNDSIINVNPLTDTMYVAIAEKKPGCFVKDSVRVAVLFSPSVSLGNDTSLCSGQSLSLNAGNNFSSYEWSTGDVSEMITVNSAGTYSVKATAANGCSSADTLKILNVSPLPIFTLGNDTTLCQGQVVSYNFNLPGSIYLWNNGSNSGNTTITDAGLYWLKVTNQGCAATDSISIYYQPSPVVYLGNDTVLCGDVTRELNAYNANATYRWQDGSIMPFYLITKPGLYYVTADINGCEAKDSITISYKSKPEVKLSADTTICTGQEILLHPVTSTNDNYLWQDGSTNISLKIKDPGIYTLIASNECGSAVHSVNVDRGICELFMPTAFTPDNNGNNDVFRVKYIFYVRNFSFTIYNRYGEPVFETNNINAGWDGKYKGVDQNMGGYVWTISFTDVKNTRKFFKGTVLLVR